MAARTRHPVIIVGGGLSGLAAGVELSGSGVPVLLLEQAPAPGGRARSFQHPPTNDEVDNGQHLLIAGYTHTLALLSRIGSQHLIDVQKQPVLSFHHPVRGFVDFRLPPLPSPLHFAWAILSTPMLSLRDRFALLRGGGALLEEHSVQAAGMTIAQWLDSHRQSGEVRRCFWEPLAVAIMNESIDRAPARLFLDALRQAFLRHRRDAALVFPRAGLSRLFAGPAAAYIGGHGGEVRCNAGVAQVIVQNGSATEVVLRDGERVRCSAVILAVPAMQLPQLLPESVASGFSTMSEAAASPIIGIHLWMDHGFMDREAVGLIGKRIQWVFRRERHLSLVISAAYRFAGLTNDELAGIALEDLRSVFGGAVQEPSHVLVIRERKATFAPTPGNENRRPGAETGIFNLFLAGDWTDTGLPATIEGAIVSGQRAATMAARALQLK